MAKIFMDNDETISQEQFLSVLDKEQKGYLKAMDLPKGIAANSALLENVFVTLVCILNRIPIFIVGKPGQRRGREMGVRDESVTR
jgi:E3 ubiquitin-protein ligase RNF213